MKWIWLVDSDENSVNTYGEFADSFRITFDCPSEDTDVPGASGDQPEAYPATPASSASAGNGGAFAFLPGDRFIMRICADSQYVLWVNGSYCSSGQFADYPDAKVYDEIDVSEFLREGDNELAFLIYYQGRSTSTYRHGQPGFCYELKNGRHVIASSSTATSGRLSPYYRSGNAEMVSPQLGYTFEYDASAAGNAVPFFPCEESGAIIEFADYPVRKPEFDKNIVYIYPRPVKKLIIGDPQRSRIVTQGLFRINPEENGKTTAEKLQRASLSQRYSQEITDRGHTALMELSCDGEVEPVRFRHDAVKNFHGIYVLIDLMKESAGYFHIDIDAPAGTRVYVGYGEHLNDLRVRSFVGGRCFTGVYTCGGGRQSFTHFNKRLGLRYIQLFVDAFGFDLYYAGIRPADYPLKDVCAFRSSDSLHDRIYQVSVDTLRLCMHEHYEDCPWREQALYAMDSRNQMLSGYYAFGEYEFPKASIRLLGQGLRADGLLELCAPADVSVSIPCFSLMWIVELYEYVLYSGDLFFAAEEFPVLARIIREFWTRSRGKDLLGPWKNQGDWNFYEWSDWMSDSVPAALRDETLPNYDAPLTLFYILALDAASKLAALLVRRHPEDDETDYRRQYSWYEMLRDSAKAAFHGAFWNDERKAYATYIVNGEKVHFSELTHALALYAGAVPNEFIGHTADILTGRRSPVLIGYADEAERIAPGCPKGIVPVTLSHSVFKYEALMKCGPGYADYVMNDIAAKWGYMLYNGATSFWEHLDGAMAFGDAGSLCHGWSAIPVIIYAKYILGITPTRPGFASYEFAPVQSGILKASGRIPAPDGNGVEVNISPSGAEKYPVRL